MKQMTTIIIASLCFLLTAKAQVLFKTIHFTYNQMVSDGIGGEYAHVSSSSYSVGTIDIDVKDSVIRIQTGVPGSYGAKLKTYKFNLFDPEQTAIKEGGVTLNNIALHGVNPKGIPYNALLARQTEKGKKDVMQFYITYDKQNQEIFVCDYEKDIYK